MKTNCGTLDCGECDICMEEQAISSLCDDLELSIKFKKCSNEELIKLAITTYCDYTMHPIVEEIMERLCPGWAGTDEDDAT